MTTVSRQPRALLRRGYSFTLPAPLVPEPRTAESEIVSPTKHIEDFTVSIAIHDVHLLWIRIAIGQRWRRQNHGCKPAKPNARPIIRNAVTFSIDRYLTGPAHNQDRASTVRNDHWGHSCEKLAACLRGTETFASGSSPPWKSALLAANQP